MAHSPVDRSRQRAEQIIQGFAFNGAFHAALVGQFLEASGLIPSREARGRKPVAVPAGFLFELAGVLRLAYWEKLGLKDHLPSQLPSAAEALDDLLGRWSGNMPHPVRASAPILDQVLHTWFARFAWSGLEELEADVVLDDADEEELLEALADFLWTHRHAGQTGD